MGVQAGDVASTSNASGDFMDEYSEALQHELQQSSLAKSFATAEKDEPDQVICCSYAFLNHDSFITSNLQQDNCLAVCSKRRLVGFILLSLCFFW